MTVGTGPGDGFLGVLMLATRFPRPVGDVGHPASWSIPVRFRVVDGATPARVVPDGGDRALLRPFIEAARALAGEGARAITTSCGFLVRWQSELQSAVPVPVWTSSLLALPALKAPGVLTVAAGHLGAVELRAAGARADTPVEGLTDGCALQRTLLRDLPELDGAVAEAETVAAARRLVARHPEVRSVVLECTNLPPYAEAVRQAVGRPVHHLMTLVHERWKHLP